MTTGFITLDNVSLNDGVGDSGTFSQTTITIDYTALTATGSITFNYAGGGSDTFTNFTLTPVAGGPGGGNYILTASDASGASLKLVWTGTNPHGFNFGTSETSSGGTDYNQFTTNTIAPVICFAAGTLIRTPAGEVAVEKLKAGDIVLTASGDMRPVKWMGHTEVDFRRTPNGSPGLPIRIAADAFGPGRPSKDLYLTAGHSVCVDLVGEVLIPVGHLANGSTIAEIAVDEIAYWHVELDGHDILVANDLPAESYLAMGNRGAFEELRGLLPAMLEGRDRSHADFCRPVVTGGPVLHFVRQRLLARAEELGWKPVRGADLRLEIDGRIVRPVVQEGAATFLFPAGARNLRLISDTFLPATVGSTDPRILGVMLEGLAFSGSDGGQPRRVALDDDRLRDGVYHVEDHGGGPRRWTDGNLVLDPQLWERLPGPVTLLVTYDHTTVRSWTAPATLAKGVDAADRPKLYAVG